MSTKQKPPKFKGTIEELQERLKDVSGEWSDDDSGKHTFRTTDGGVLNWWASNKTIQLQGQPDAEAVLEAAVLGGQPQSHPSVPVQTSDVLNRPAQSIFIVHGHDKDARDQLELALHRLGLQPYILMNTSG